jgi:hypothetical protein
MIEYLLRAMNYVTLWCVWIYIYIYLLLKQIVWGIGGIGENEKIVGRDMENGVFVVVVVGSRCASSSL